jgi:hypothetical protein
MVADTRSAIMIERHHLRVQFRFRAPARQVYLMARSAEDVAWSLNQMAPSPLDDGLWELLLPLSPGRHRVRYYVDDGQRIVYCEPSDAAETSMEGLDLIVDVPEGSTAGLLVPATDTAAAPSGRYRRGDAAADEYRWAKLF